MELKKTGIVLGLIITFQMTSAFADTVGNVPIRILPTKAKSSNLQAQQLVDLVRSNFDLSSAREARVQAIFNASGKSDHVLVYVLRKGVHGFKLSSVKVDANNNVKSIDSNYRATAQDFAQQPGSSTDYKCPDASVEFISFAPNDNDLEQQITVGVADAADAHHLKAVRLLKADATRQNYLNYMVCPNLKGNFYDGDSNPSEFITVDGLIGAQEVSTILKNTFRHKVVNIWLACEAFNDPMLSAVTKDAQAQKYAAGKNDLQVGPSDETGKCAMIAALDGQAMTAAFNDCYKRLDVTSDQWGFDGDGSDYFGK